MYISKMFAEKKPLVSFEIFPPKKQGGLDSIRGTIEQLSQENPDFISVTCGAGGVGSVGQTGDIAGMIKQDCDVESLAHLTCIGASRDAIRATLSSLKANGVENILALRGDLPAGSCPLDNSFKHASDLIQEIDDFGGFCIGAACYPEGHVECEDIYADLAHLKEKEQLGASFLITQLFFDNDYFFRFLDRARSAGISIPVTAGVMPILGRSQIERMIFMCGASLPSSIIRLLHQYENNPSDLRKAGIEYALKQVDGLLHGGADGVHIYTMNQPEIARTAMKQIR